MNATEQFAAEAAAFRDWAARGTDVGEVAARNALIRISRLFIAALELPPAWAGGFTDQPDAEHVSDAEWRAVCSAAARLPLEYYGVCDPMDVTLEAPGLGSLSDDIADIYRDVVGGLRAFESGRSREAAWRWEYWFGRHWGTHAAEAIGALHAWRAANARDRFASDPAPDGEDGAAPTG